MNKMALSHNKDKSSPAVVDYATATPLTTFPSPEFETSIKYLAYGSNMCAETFLGNRGIKPLSQVNVRVPSLELKFDLPGIPYFEPRFANVGFRDETDPMSREVIGVVYEVTKEDYKRILVTEGGYDQISVECFPLPTPSPINPAADYNPMPKSFMAQTLIVPKKMRRSKPGQPSLRYLTLLIHGAREHSLPLDYQLYLESLQHYHRTTLRQRIGGVALLPIIAPLFMSMVMARKLLSDEHGRAPKWIDVYTRIAFGGIWLAYDGGYKFIFADGEVTIGGNRLAERKEVDDAVSLLEEMMDEGYGTEKSSSTF